MQIVRKALCAVSLIDVFVEDQANHFRLILVDLQVQHCAVALIDAAFIYRAIAIRNCSAGVMPLLCKLPQAGFRADRGFQTLAGGLPVADVVHQLVNVIVEPLLPLHRTPDLHAVLDEPFYNEWCFIIPSSEPVKHEHEQNIEFAKRSIMLNFLNGVAVFGGYLVARNAFFRKLLDNHPALLFCEVTANLFLHRNIIFFNLTDGRNSVKRVNTRNVGFIDCLFHYTYLVSVLDRLKDDVSGPFSLFSIFKVQVHHHYCIEVTKMQMCGGYFLSLEASRISWILSSTLPADGAGGFGR